MPISRASGDLRFGSKQTFAVQSGMSALAPEADICGALLRVCFGPKADMTGVGENP
jgi:hypothetical protein